MNSHLIHIFIILLGFAVEEFGDVAAEIAEAHDEERGGARFIEVADKREVVGDEFEDPHRWVDEIKHGEQHHDDDGDCSHGSSSSSMERFDSVSGMVVTSLAKVTLMLGL